MPSTSKRRSSAAPASAGSMRMAELSQKSGVARETIHFYLREGLLPRPEKGGRTVAYYGEEHLARLRLIRRLREEKYLPIAVIRRLVESGSAAADSDVEALAEVLHILPADAEEPREASRAAREEAARRGLLGPRRAPSDGDAAEAHVLAIVDEVLALDDDARSLTLDDLAACADDVGRLVERESALFFDRVFASGDVGRAIGALRTGRGKVARYIAAYRDLLLRRIVDDLLAAIRKGPESVERARTVPLSHEREAELEIHKVRARLVSSFDHARGEEARATAARGLLAHWIGTGASVELARARADVLAAAGPGATALAAYGAFEAERSTANLRAFERAVAPPSFALAEILLGEAIVARGLKGRGEAGVLGQAVPALSRLASADPERDRHPLFVALGWFHRGRVECALPRMLGRGARGRAAVERALFLLDLHRDEIDPIASARLTLNAFLALGRYFAANGDPERARASFARAALVDPEGPIARVVADEDPG